MDPSGDLSQTPVGMEAIHVWRPVGLKMADLGPNVFIRKLDPGEK
jgi:hypothetical protein